MQGAVHHNLYEVNTNIFTSQMKNLKIRVFESLFLSPTVLHGRLQTLSTSSWKGLMQGLWNHRLGTGVLKGHSL